jgi:aldehyde:ferredoxin oxidoreductase
MGAKRLKAIVVVPDQLPDPYDPSTLQGITDRYRENIPGNVLSAEQAEPPGFGAWPLTSDITGRVGVRNFTTSRIVSESTIRSDVLTDRLARSADGCPGCPSDCVKTFTNSVDDRAGGLGEEFLACFSVGLGIRNPTQLLDLNAQCHDWGVDPVSLAGVIAFALEAQDRGLTKLPAGVDGGRTEFGNGAGIVDLARRIAMRDPDVAWLGEGVRRAAGRLGPAATDCALEVKGLEMTPFDPRTSAGLALAWAVSPLGPRYEIVEHDIDMDPVEGYPHGLDQMYALGTQDWEPMARLDLSRVERTAKLIDLWSGLDALGLCIFASPPMRTLTPDDVAQIVEAVTGWPATVDDILTWGQRRWQLIRTYNLREGLTAADDRLPERFFTLPVDAGRHAGTVLDRAAFTTAIRHYYALAGWDEEGRPRTEALARLGLGWVEDSHPSPCPAPLREPEMP